MEELRANIREVAQVLLSINVPIRLMGQIGDPIQRCVDRLIFLAEEQAKPEEKPEEQKKPEE